MPQELPLIFNVAIALAIAVAGGFLASWMRQSPILGYLLAGVLIGPFTPGFVGDRHQIAELAEVGVIFLMFALGVAFSLKDLARVRRIAVGGTVIQVLITVAGGALLARALNWTGMQGLFFGATLVASSSMVILKTLLDRGEIASGHGRLLLSMAIVQDLIVVVLIVTMPKLTSFQEHLDPVAVALDVGITLLKAAVFIALSLVVGLRLVPWVMGHVARLKSSELFIVFAAVLALGAASVSTVLGLSTALGAFVAGLVLSESEFDHRVIAEVVPVRDLFATLFFVSVGMLIDVRFIIEHWPLVILTALFILVLKSVATFLGVVPFRITAKTAAFTSVGMVPVGELNFVLAQVGLGVNILTTDMYNLVLTSSLVTIVMTPFGFRAAPRIADRWRSSRFWARFFDSVSSLQGSGAQLEAHAIVVGFGRVGHSVARGLRDAGMRVAIIDARISRVREGVADGLTAVYGSAASATVLAAAQIENARLVVVALPDHGPARATIQQVRAMNPNAVIAARAEQPGDEVVLRNAGAEIVIVPELAGATALLDGVLEVLKLPHLPH
jgi:monovalent cation:H+ antiporter-2, CPA2 family